MKINYVIARYWDKEEKEVCPYMECNNQVFRGTEKQAFAHCKRISEKENKRYKVFRLLDIGTYYDDDPC